jgi:hypothetical protein
MLIFNRRRAPKNAKNIHEKYQTVYAVNPVIINDNYPYVKIYSYKSLIKQQKTPPTQCLAIIYLRLWTIITF